MMEKEIFWANEMLILTNQRAIFWPKHEMLILSDLHLGKAAHFRKNGIPLPGSVHQDDLKRLATLIKYFHAKELVIVGDFIHANANKEVCNFQEFIAQFPTLNMILIRGNHDRLSTNKLKEIGFSAVYDSYQVGKIRFTHEPQNDHIGPMIVGHIHPGVTLKMPTGTRLRLPVFMLAPNQLVLPAFSKFTGLDTRYKIAAARYYAFYEDGIIEVANQEF